MATLQHRARPNGRADKVEHTPGDMQCPTCNSPISAEKLAEIQGTLRAHDAEIVRTAETRFSAREAAIRREAMTAATAAANAAVEEKLAKAEQEKKVAQQQAKGLKAGQDAAIKRAVEAMRETADKKMVAAVNAEKLQHAAEKLKLEGQLADMQRRLQAKTSHQIGEPAEVDLYDALVAAFPGDRVGRVRKGAKGPDVLVEVVHQQAVVGRIALDSKAVSRWSNKFTSKLRSDQLAYGADFGVLVSTAFPNGTRELHLQDGIVVVNPARAVVLVQLIRRHILETYRLRITGRARNEKGEALLAYVVSPDANDLFERRRRAADDMISLECKEVDQHHATWRKRGELIRVVQKTDEELVGAIDRIIGGASDVTPEQEVAA